MGVINNSPWNGLECEMDKIILRSWLSSICNKQSLLQRAMKAFATFIALHIYLE
jgi:hypothetical protein